MNMITLVLFIHGAGVVISAVGLVTLWFRRRRATVACIVLSYACLGIGWGLS